MYIIIHVHVCIIHFHMQSHVLDEGCRVRLPEVCHTHLVIVNRHSGWYSGHLLLMLRGWEGENVQG